MQSFQCFLWSFSHFKTGASSSSCFSTNPTQIYKTLTFNSKTVCSTNHTVYTVLNIKSLQLHWNQKLSIFFLHYTLKFLTCGSQILHNKNQPPQPRSHLFSFDYVWKEDIFFYQFSDYKEKADPTNLFSWEKGRDPQKSPPRDVSFCIVRSEIKQI